MKIRLTEEILKEGNMYVSYCPELDVASCGEDVEQAKKICGKYNHPYILKKDIEKISDSISQIMNL